MPKNSKRILIVEDEPALLQILSDQFQSEGFEVLTARNGEEGLKIALKETPNLMIVDVVMPKMDGVTMLKKIREDERGKTIPAMVLSNLSDPGTTAKALESEVYDYLVKTDWTLDDLVS